MKSCYIISFDLKPNRSYTTLTEAIKEYKTWAKLTESTWAVVSERTAVEIRNDLKQHLEGADRIFVIKSGDSAAWRNIIASKDWLKKTLSKERDMRSKFPGFYTPTEEEFSRIWESGIFIFDTNVLLDLYRYSDETVENLLSTMERMKDRIWIPYRVAFEYHRHLNGIIEEQAKEYSKTIELLTSFSNKFKERRKHPFLSKELHQEIEDFRDKLDHKLKQKQDVIKSLLLNNPTKNRLSNLIQNKVGDPFSEEELGKIYQEGARRYSSKTPPGYKDKGNKPGDEIYGDLVIWKEICKKAQEVNNPIVFVTGDVKEDWFQIVMGMTVGPRAELVSEIMKYREILFYIYPTNNYLKYAEQYLKIDIKEEAIIEIKEVISENRKALQEIESAYNESDNDLEEELSEFEITDTNSADSQEADADSQEADNEDSIESN